MDRELSKQIKRLNKQENKILNHKENQLIKSKIDPVIGKITEKIPDKLIITLESAFIKGFELVFEKGYVYVEKTYNKDKVQLEYDLNNQSIEQKMSKENIKRLDKQANNSKKLNSVISVIEGSALGLLGIGLPDIPLFIALIMKNISEITLSYGYEYETKQEKALILLLICGAISKGDKQKIFNEEIENLGKSIDKNIDTEIDLEERIKNAASVLSDAILTAKFIQGIPIIGVVGGVVNYTIIRKISKYATIKYKKRYLLGKIK